MLVIPMYQPYASAVALGLKRVETRPGRTHYLGLVAIHACASFPVKYRDAYAALPDQIRQKLAIAFPIGQIIAVAELVACISSDRFRLNGTVSVEDGNRIVTVEVTDQERALGDYSPGRFGWVLENVRAVSGPLHYKAHQGCYRLPEEIAKEVLRRIG